MCRLRRDTVDGRSLLSVAATRRASSDGGHKPVCTRPKLLIRVNCNHRCVITSFVRVEDLRTGGWDDSRRVRLKCVDISMKHFVMNNKNSLVRERFVDGMIFPFFFFKISLLSNFPQQIKIIFNRVSGVTCCNCWRRNFSIWTKKKKRKYNVIPKISSSIKITCIKYPPLSPLLLQFRGRGEKFSSSPKKISRFVSSSYEWKEK